jgi:hypothetical protein
VAAIQAVPGVAFVDLDTLDAISLAGSTAKKVGLALRQRVRAELARVEAVVPAAVPVAVGGIHVVRSTSTAPPERRLLAAQLAILKADVPDTLLLTELPA